MRAQEQGYLLLCCGLGQRDAVPLRMSELRLLRQRVRAVQSPQQDRELSEEDLLRLSYSPEEAGRIVRLLSREEQLSVYLHKLKSRGIVPITCVSEAYPTRLLEKLGDEAPAVLFALGDTALLQRSAVALVGSRDIREENARFAEAVGKAAARSGLALVSGNAVGADRLAQQAALSAGGSVIAFVAGRLTDCTPMHNAVYLSEEGGAVPFSSFRALRRNHLIHALAQRSFVAQCTEGHGGSWAGAVANLRHGYSPLCVFADGSGGQQALCALGAAAVKQQDLEHII